MKMQSTHLAQQKSQSSTCGLREARSTPLRHRYRSSAVPCPTALHQPAVSEPVAAQSSSVPSNGSRREWLAMAAAVAVLGQQAAQPGPASAVRASSLCVDALTEEADAECRRAALAGDIDQLNNYGTASTSRKFELAPNVPAAVLNDEYTVATLKLGSEIEEYCALDVYDKGRVPLIKSLKSDGTAWVSKYARGGSARTQSARRMYIAVDSVVGHLASNGYAPLPAPKVKAVLKSVGEARDFLAKGI